MRTARYEGRGTARQVLVGGGVSSSSTHPEPSIPYGELGFADITFRLIGSDDFHREVNAHAASELTDTLLDGALRIPAVPLPLEQPDEEFGTIRQVSQPARCDKTRPATRPHAEAGGLPGRADRPCLVILRVILPPVDLGVSGCGFRGPDLWPGAQKRSSGHRYASRCAAATRVQVPPRTPISAGQRPVITVRDTPVILIDPRMADFGRATKLLSSPESGRHRDRPSGSGPGS